MIYKFDYLIAKNILIHKLNWYYSTWDNETWLNNIYMESNDQNLNLVASY